jgi:two-component SAPR family response regulator
MAAMATPVVLAIDDDAAILKLIAMSLEPAGYEVRVFEKPKAALAELEDGFKPDVVVCDVSMPELSGFDVYRRIQGLEGLEGVPFLFLSALAQRHDIRQGMSLGADDYLTKPFAPGELVQAVAVRLARHEELRRPAQGLISARGLAGAEVSRDGTPLSWDSQKALELFFYLLENRAGVTTWQVAEALWPGKNEAKASSSFHTTLYRLRRVIGDEVIESSNRRYYLHGGFSVDYDVERYRALAERAKEIRTLPAFEEAITAYSGGFLPGYDSPWIQDARRDLFDEQLTLLLLAAESCREAGKLETASQFYRRMILHAPDSSAAWQGLIEALEASGQLEAAEAVRREAAELS